MSLRHLLAVSTIHSLTGCPLRELLLQFGDHMMEEEEARSSRGNIASNALTGDGDDDLFKRPRTDEHPGIVPTIPPVVKTAAAVANAAAAAKATAHHPQHHHDHVVSAAASTNVGPVVVLLQQTRGGGGRREQQQLPPPISINNGDHSPTKSSSSSSTFHRISLSPPGALPLSATSASASASGRASSSNAQQRENDDIMSRTTSTAAAAAAAAAAVSTMIACPSRISDPATIGTSSINNRSSIIHSGKCSEGNKDSPAAAAAFDSPNNGTVAMIQQQAFLPARRRNFRNKLVRVVKRRYIPVLVGVVVVALVGSVYTMQQQQQQQHGNNIPPTPPASFLTRWLTPSLQQKSKQRQQQLQQQDSKTLMPRQGGQRDPVTLRDFLSHGDGFSLAMAPAFFGFYGYFGALAAWEDAISTSLLRDHEDSPTTKASDGSSSSRRRLLQHVSGASAGAMAAVLLAAGVSPKRAAEFCETITLSKFADFPGFGAVFRGYKFESIMHEFLVSEIQLQQQQRQSLPRQDERNTTTNTTTAAVDDDESLPLLLQLQLQNARVPVAVTALDIETMQTKILTRGSMAKAARASATFPFLFQPVGWVDDIDDDEDDKHCKNAANMNNNSKNQKLDATLIDGGIRDHAGVDGLKAFVEMDASDSQCKTAARPGGRLSNIPPPRRIVQLAVGGFLLDNPPGPGYISPSANQVVSISLNNLPTCGPWPSGLHNGPIAVQAAYRAMMAALDIPLLEFRRQEASQQENDNHDDTDGDKSLSVHYELQLDAAPFWKSS
jgi:Patatin-like phospholipase